MATSVCGETTVISLWSVFQVIPTFLCSVVKWARTTGAAQMDCQVDTLFLKSLSFNCMYFKWQLMTEEVWNNLLVGAIIMYQLIETHLESVLYRSKWSISVVWKRLRRSSWIVEVVNQLSANSGFFSGATQKRPALKVLCVFMCVFPKLCPERAAEAIRR